MYVCVCNAINDHQLITAIRGGKKSVGELRNHFRLEKSCGRCNRCMRKLINDHQGKQCRGDESLGCPP